MVKVKDLNELTEVNQSELVDQQQMDIEGDQIENTVSTTSPKKKKKIVKKTVVRKKKKGETIVVNDDEFD